MYAPFGSRVRTVADHLNSWREMHLLPLGGWKRLLLLSSAPLHEEADWANSSCVVNAGWQSFHMADKPFYLSVRAIILDSDFRCLLVRRSAQNRNFAGCWEWPGGKVESGENFNDALIREVHEETSLTVEITKLAGATQYETPTANVVMICMEVRVVRGEIQLSSEHDDFAWVPFQQFTNRILPNLERKFILDYAAKRLFSAPASFGSTT